MKKNLCNDTDAVAFVNAHRQDATWVANLLNVPVENVLGLAAHETGYGTGNIAKKYKNYFSMHAPAPFQIGEEVAQRDHHVKVAVFKNFIEGGQSFVSRFGLYVRGKSDPREFAEGLIKARYNSGKSADGGSDGYVDQIVNIIQVVKVRMECRIK